MNREDSRKELARRLNRIFIAEVGKEGTDVPDEVLLDMADAVLAADYTDPRWGPRPGDGGPRVFLTAQERIG